MTAISPGRKRGAKRRWHALALALAGLAVALAGTPSCMGAPRVGDRELEESVTDTMAKLKEAWDPRLFVLEAEARVTSGVVTLSGWVDGVKHDELLSAVSGLPGLRRVVDGLARLPDPALGRASFGLVTVTVANLGDAPGQDEGDHLVTQARLADPLEVLREEGGWYLVRMLDDGYLGWLKGESLVRVETEAGQAYGAGEQVLVTALVAGLHEAAVSRARGGASPPGANPSPVAITGVMGTVLPAAERRAAGASDEGVAVKLPGGQVVYAEASEVRRLPSALAAFADKRPAEDIVALATQLLGLPYLWGGTTPYGFDCSGFVQFVFRMNGYELPRDADMQFACGTPVPDRSALEPGDLVFWSTYKAGPSHVGVCAGGGRYVHAGGSNGVSINSFDPSAADYSEKLDKAYIGARRILGGR